MIARLADESAAVVAVAHSDEAGRFELFVPPGPSIVASTRDGYARAATEVVAPVQGLTLVLGPAAILTGRVIARDGGRPVADVEVTAAKVSGGLDRQAARSDRDGKFRFARSSAGAYVLTAVAARWRSGGGRWAVVGMASCRCR